MAVKPPYLLALAPPRPGARWWLRLYPVLPHYERSCNKLLPTAVDLWLPQMCCLLCTYSRVWCVLPLLKRRHAKAWLPQRVLGNETLLPAVANGGLRYEVSLTRLPEFGITRSDTVFAIKSRLT